MSVAVLASNLAIHRKGKLMCHMGSHSVTCHPTEVRIPPLPPAEAGTWFSDPGGMQGWVGHRFSWTTSAITMNPIGNDL